MSPEERVEFDSLKRDVQMLKRMFTVDSGRLILEKPTIIRGTLNVNGITIFTGNGSPEGVVTANVGSIYLRLDGTSGATLYMKESGTGSTGWSTTA